MKATLVGAQRDNDFYFDLAVVERAGGEVVELDWMGGKIGERPARAGETHAEAVSHYNTMRRTLYDLKVADEAQVRAKLGVKIDELVVDPSEEPRDPVVRPQGFA
ncbi:MAG: hypothetical protein EXR76_10125 [Myxococcales bacterium]|nr:hypothetical protein [Myxococcales bacterium]